MNAMFQSLRLLVLVGALSLGQAALVPFGDALDAPELAWTTGGATPWLGQSAVSHDGADAARSGMVAAYQESWMETSVSGPGKLSFWWQVDTASWGFLRVQVNGAELARVSGSTPWQRQVFWLGDGPQVVRWSFSPDFYVYGWYQNAGWVDQVVFTPGPSAPVIRQSPTNATVVSKGVTQLAVVAGGTPPLSYQWLFNGTILPGATSPVLSFNLATPSQSGPYAVRVTNAFGATTSAVAMLTVLPPPASARLEFTSMPAYGSFEWLEGKATGVPPSLYRVAVYIYVHGWWTKPYWAAPLTVIQPDGSWQCDVTTGGSDEYATKFAAFLVPATYSPPSLGGSSQFPADLEDHALAKLITLRGGREIRFSGHDWLVKQGFWGPGPNTFSDSGDNVWVDKAGELHLRITSRGGAWQCAEIIGKQPLGYGDYQFTLGTAVHGLNPNVVLGLFTWSDDSAYAYRELDIEFSRWGQAGSADNAQYVVQPYDQANHRHRFPWPAGIASSAHSIVWDRNRAHFRSARGDSAWPADPQDLLHEWEFPNPSQVPPKGDESPRINLWLLNGAAPTDGQEVEVVVKRFQFTPFGPPTIQVQPVSRTVVSGAAASFHVAVLAQSAVSYQWRFNQVDLPGATNASLRLTNVAPSQVGSYTVVASGSGGSVTSAVAQLMISDLPPVVLAPPHDAAVLAGQPVGFEVQAGGPRPWSFQWRFKGTTLPGATNASLGLAAVGPDDAGNYRAVISNPVGSVTSSPARLTVLVPATVAVSPQGRVVFAGSNTTFTVEATGTAPLSYQWQRDGVPLPASSGASLTFSNVALSQSGRYSVLVWNPWGTNVSAEALLTVVTNRTPRESAALSLAYLRRVMDKDHTRFPVYADIGSAGNHFHARGLLPGPGAPAGVNGSWPDNPHSGATCIRCTFTNTSASAYGGFYFLNGLVPPGSSAPLPYFGNRIIPGTTNRVDRFTGYDLSGARALTFWARGESGGEQIEFFLGGVGRDPGTGAATEAFPDSTPRYPSRGTVVVLSAQWQKFTFDLAGLNLTNIMGGFGWMAAAPQNPRGAVFYLDDIQYALSPGGQARRLNEPRFLCSFSTLPKQTDPFDEAQDEDLDFVLRNTAFTYDNALALLAFLAEGSPDGLQRARLIGDAFVYAGDHDRRFTNGQFRTAYAAGDLALPPGWSPAGLAGTVAIPGFYVEPSQQFYEVEQEAIDTGNNAWVMIALLALHQRTGESSYLNAARRTGDFILTLRQGSGLYQGFLAGIADAESATPARRTYASSEHNLDAAAAFTRLFQITGEAEWRDAADHARLFVEAMWEPQLGSYLAGTTEPMNRNTGAKQLPVDVQAWSVLVLSNALSLHPALLQRADEHHANTHDGFAGYDFNNNRDGVWFEGTAQMAVSHLLAGEQASADLLRATLRSAQQWAAPYGDGSGLVAACHDGVSSGFGFKLFRRMHVGATAWNVFAQLQHNPFFQTSAAPDQPACSLTLKPPSRVHGPAPEAGEFRVRTDGGCLWTLSNSNQWLTLLGPHAGEGPDTVRYLLATNASAAYRTGLVSVSGVEFRVTQTPANLPPALLVQPTNQSAVAGETVRFAVQAAGTEPLRYQWRLNGQDLVSQERIRDVTSPTLVIVGVGASDAGTYRVHVSNAHGVTVSDRARLSLVTSVGMSGAATASLSSSAADRAPGATLAAAPKLALCFEPDGVPRLRCIGLSGGTYVVETSEDLVGWTRLTGLTVVRDSDELADYAPSRRACRFYRLVRLP